VVKTKELKKRLWGRRRQRIITSLFGKSRLARAALPFSTTRVTEKRRPEEEEGDGAVEGFVLWYTA